MKKSYFLKHCLCIWCIGKDLYILSIFLYSMIILYFPRTKIGELFYDLKSRQGVAFYQEDERVAGLMVVNFRNDASLQMILDGSVDNDSSVRPREFEVDKTVFSNLIASILQYHASGTISPAQALADFPREEIDRAA